MENILDRLLGEAMLEITADRRKMGNLFCHPVFTAIEVYSDNNGNLAISIQAKKEIIKGGNGKETPDVRCYCLVYVEPNYVGSIHAKDKAPFYDNWRTWSSDTYSG